MSGVLALPLGTAVGHDSINLEDMGYRFVDLCIMFALMLKCWKLFSCNCSLIFLSTFFYSLRFNKDLRFFA